MDGQTDGKTDGRTKPLLVIWILDRVYGLIFPVKVYILPSRQARENIHFDREYESIYPVKNPYNEYVVMIMYYCRAINVEL
jgi:hypothetical protein